MKNILIILDGMEDIKYKELNWMTPLEFSDCEFTKTIKLKHKINTTPIGLETDSMNCILNLLGVDKKYIPKGRAYLEALANGIKIKDNDLVMRANSVIVDNDKNVISNYSNDTSEIIKAFNKNCDFEIINLKEYRNLFIIRNGIKYFKDLITYAPHQNFGKNIKALLPEGNELALKLKEACIKILDCSNVCFVPWSPSIKCNIPFFCDELGAVVCCTDIVKGICKSLRLDCYVPQNSTGDIDTNLYEKTKMVINLIEKYDFVILHINGLDEASHRKNLLQKVNFLKKIDIEVISPIIKNCKKYTRITILSDHATLCSNGSHSNIPVSVYEIYL